MSSTKLPPSRCTTLPSVRVKHRLTCFFDLVPPRTPTAAAVKQPAKQPTGGGSGSAKQSTKRSAKQPAGGEPGSAKQQGRGAAPATQEEDGDSVMSGTASDADESDSSSEGEASDDEMDEDSEGTLPGTLKVSKGSAVVTSKQKGSSNVSKASAAQTDEPQGKSIRKPMRSFFRKAFEHIISEDGLAHSPRTLALSPLKQSDPDDILGDDAIPNMLGWLAKKDLPGLCSFGFGPDNCIVALFDSEETCAAATIKLNKEGSKKFKSKLGGKSLVRKLDPPSSSCRTTDQLWFIQSGQCEAPVHVGKAVQGWLKQSGAKLIGFRIKPITFDSVYLPFWLLKFDEAVQLPDSLYVYTVRRAVQKAHAEKCDFCNSITHSAWRCKKGPLKAEKVCAAGGIREVIRYRTYFKDVTDLKVDLDSEGERMDWGSKLQMNVDHWSDSD